MRFKVKSDLDLMWTTIKVLVFIICFGILGGAIYMATYSDTVIILYSVFVLAFVVLYLIQLIIESITLESGTDTERLLKEVLEELRELKNSQNKK